LFWFIDEFDLITVRLCGPFEKIIYSAIIVDFTLFVLSHVVRACARCFPYITTLLFISVLYSVFKVRNVSGGTCGFLGAVLKFLKAAAFRNFLCGFAEACRKFV